MEMEMTSRSWNDGAVEWSGNGGRSGSGWMEVGWGGGGQMDGSDMGSSHHSPPPHPIQSCITPACLAMPLACLVPGCVATCLLLTACPTLACLMPYLQALVPLLLTPAIYVLYACHAQPCEGQWPMPRHAFPCHPAMTCLLPVFMLFLLPCPLPCKHVCLYAMLPPCLPAHGCLSARLLPCWLHLMPV